MTIAANLTKNVNPLVLNYCIKQSFFIFVTQLLISVLFLWDYKGFNKFQPIDTFFTPVRMVLAMLLQKLMLSELENATRMLTFLKRLKKHKKNLRGRTINIIIVSMQIISALLANFVNMVSLS